MWVFVALSLLWIFHYYFKRRNYAPGPPTLPLFGCLPFTRKLKPLHLMLEHYTDAKIARFDLGARCIHVINDFNLAKELFNKDAFCEREQTWWVNNVRGKNNTACGIINTHGPIWTEQRRFALTKLRDFGFGRKGLDAVMQEEAMQLIQAMLDTSTHLGEVLVDNLFSVYIVNVLWQIVSSQRYDPEAQETKEMMTELNNRFRTGFNWRSFVPYRQLAPYGPGDRAIFASKDRMHKLIEEHEVDLAEGQAPRDFIDVYLAEMKKPGTSETFNKDQLVTTILDFFEAGAETSSTTLTWALMYMALHRDVQIRVREEIDSVLGESLPQQADMPKLVYTMATIMEIQRISTTAPGVLFHRNVEDLYIDGYVIPKGSNLTANVRKFLLDPAVFENPLQFNPERFLHNGQIVKYDQFVPFGMGKRICMGEALAKQEIFIFFVMILQSMHILVADHRPEPNPASFTMGITVIPTPFYIKIEKR